MTHREFAYWLQGFFEVMQPKSLTKEQVLAIKTNLGETLHEEKSEQISPDSSKPRARPRDLGEFWQRGSTIGGTRLC
jgi:hypothetical protein